jgi:antitoxin MazE
VILDAGPVRTYNVITLMRTHLIRVGNSRGIRIPKPLLDQVGLEDAVQIRAEKGRLVILPDRAPRQGWAAAFSGAAVLESGGGLLGEVTNAFDSEEWTW